MAWHGEKSLLGSIEYSRISDRLGGNVPGDGDWRAMSRPAGKGDPMRIVALVLIAALLAGRNVFDAYSDGLKHSEAVKTDMKEAFGVEPFVGFQWHNGSMHDVAVAFTDVPADQSVSEVIERAKESVRSNFTEMPEQVTVSFTVVEESGWGLVRGLSRFGCLPYKSRLWTGPLEFNENFLSVLRIKIQELLSQQLRELQSEQRR